MLSAIGLRRQGAFFGLSRLCPLQLNHGTARPSSFRRRGVEALDQRMPRQKLGNDTPQDPLSVPVNDPHHLGAREIRAIEELVDPALGFVGAHPDDLELGLDGAIDVGFGGRRAAPERRRSAARLRASFSARAASLRSRSPRTSASDSAVKSESTRSISPSNRARRSASRRANSASRRAYFSAVACRSLSSALCSASASSSAVLSFFR